MESKILSLNLGTPQPIEFGVQTILTSMNKKSVPGPLNVQMTSIDGNTFAAPQFHGTPEAVLYIYGMSSIQKFLDRLGVVNAGDIYVPGSLGETLTVDHFDETKVSIGDKFKIGEVIVEASFPRIPCAKVNFRMQNPRGQKAMQECGMSGVYFRILVPGKINVTDKVERIAEAKIKFMVSEIYPHVVTGKKMSEEQLQRALKNAAFPRKYLDRWSQMLLTSSS